VGSKNAVLKRTISLFSEFGRGLAYDLERNHLMSVNNWSIPHRIFMVSACKWPVRKNKIFNLFSLLKLIIPTLFNKMLISNIFCVDEVWLTRKMFVLKFKFSYFKIFLHFYYAATAGTWPNNLRNNLRSPCEGLSRLLVPFTHPNALPTEKHTKQKQWWYNNKIVYCCSRYVCVPPRRHCCRLLQRFII